jgi:pimeloyl-ACP methyl ester carboxylesterase
MIVFLHGVPETAALWDKVRSRVDAESVALALPGFGCPRPAGFGASKDEYVTWLVGELDALTGPIDLVGHDWGAILTYRVAMAHGERLRSWAADVANILHPDYVWHDLARIWQTPGEGEQFFDAQSAAPVEAIAAVFESFGIPADDAVALAEAGDETMASCILDLYRSAIPNPYQDWNDMWGPTAPPGLVIHPTADPFGDEVQSRQVAQVLGARHATLDGVGHWWPMQAPDAAADLIGEFLASVR